MTMPTPPRRRWFRFQLRTLLIVVAVVAIPLAWIAKERRQSRYEVKVAEKLHREGLRDIKFGGPYDSMELDRQSKSQGWWREAARTVLGERILWIIGPPPDFEDGVPLPVLTNAHWIPWGPRNAPISRPWPLPASG
jgi:hypothetical protein